jgi:primosomal protein N' (replication factor Y)
MLAKILFPINAEAFTYRIPQEFEQRVKPGIRVIAPFKTKTKFGIIIDYGKDVIKDNNTKYEIKDVEDIPDNEPLLTPILLRLLSWMKNYYMTSSGMALKTALPRGVLEGKKPGKARITYDEVELSYERVSLTDEQIASLAKINSTDRGVFVLHGVTGSGKTEIYMKTIETLPESRQALVLVPEIALTSQMIERFQRRFGETVAFFHSGLSEGEKIVQWHKMRSGKARVALGVRAAVFAPLPRPGLIVVDEEHEASYKQSDGLRYSARETAIIRARFEGIKIILGSATPSVESFYHATKGTFQYLRLLKRFHSRPLPHIDIVDMKQEKKVSPSFSTKLINHIRQEHKKGNQSLLLINRRGYSPYSLCTDCGYIHQCSHCSVTLTYHKDRKISMCHYCGSVTRPPALCPRCKGTSITFVGAGTQRVEEELQKIMKDLVICRMDRDTTTRKLSHQRMVKAMEKGDINLLIGTQMVARGHDFPLVTLSSVVSADVALNLPDFRSGERAFQLFTQLAGRAGRGPEQGNVVIQTYSPDHYVFDYVQKYDHEGFYKRELLMRSDLLYPPFGKLVRIIVTTNSQISKSDDDIKQQAVKVNKFMDGLFKDVNLTSEKGVEVVGPAPAPLERIKGRWRWHVLLKGTVSQALREKARIIMDKLKKNKEIKVSVDVDPVDLL